MAPVPVGTAASGQRLTRKGQETHRRIVSEAAALMYEHGVGRTSIEDVQAAAGVSASQIYHYFGDKEGLVHAVINHQRDSVLGVQKPLLANLDSIEALEAWRDVIVSIHRDGRNQQGCPMGSLSSELSRSAPEARTDLLAGFNRWEEDLRSGLLAMRERGKLPDRVDPERFALALLAAVQGGLVLTQARRDTVALEASLDTLIDCLRDHTDH
ncbi:TetR/AcrR family transcriptional regulator [Amycolatopsis sp.]|jgi:AcrR family transcriptional regulator|uniref:TetR/AcrR family transcriptional regulator n=1 Tax=Amycolatopsis sp. TaxID=37632 RepID=UPI002613F42E|nr:TetR/AcrR family transcriptional regulator [Amycolatopsis sp.]